MGFVLENLRLSELAAIVNANKPFFDDFAAFLSSQGYRDIYQFVSDPDDSRATRTISSYLARRTSVCLYDGISRPFENGRARWFFLSWILRDAPTQRLAPLLRGVPGRSMIERQTFLLNEVRKYVAPVLPGNEHWTWPVLFEVLLARLEGSRRALKGNLFEVIVRRNLEKLFESNGLHLAVGDKEVRIGDETYDVQVVGSKGTILMPVKTRETMGGGHALLFTRDIHKSIAVAEDSGYPCIPIVIAESWSGDLSSLKCERFVYIQRNPNEVGAIEPLLYAELGALVEVFRAIA